jgi:L-rhamnose mutarotase
MQRFALTLDLKDDQELIDEYEAWHRKVWPEITDGIREVGIQQMEIYRFANRMFMLIEAADDWNYELAMQRLSNLPKQAEWEELMWKFQQPLPQAMAGEKWLAMEKIFSLKE